MGPVLFHILSITTLLCLSFLGSMAMAQPSISLREPLTSLKKSEPSSSIKIKLFQYSYLSDPILREQATDVTALGLAWKKQGKKKLFGRFEYKSDIQGLFAQQESDRPYITVPDLYAKSKVARGGSVVFGRKKHSWSEFDDLWQLGIWQPLARWDYIHPQTQGLTGVFGHWSNDSASRFEVTAFASPLFLPDQGPNFQLEDGRFTSQNRWFWAPQSQVGVLSDVSRLYYKLNRPAEEDVIFHAGGGLQAKFTSESTGLWLAGAHAYKPVNQLHLGVEPSFDIEELNDSRVEVEISTAVAYHNVSTFEAGWKSEDVSTSLSLTRDSPINPGLPRDWVQSSLRETYFAGFQLDHRVNVGPFTNGKVRYAYMSSWFGDDVGGSNLISSDIDSSLSRFNFEDVAMFEVGQPLFAASGQPITVGLKYLYSFPEQGELLSAQLHWKSSRQMSWVALVDILGAGEPNDDVGNGLMSRYRANDRVALGVTYVY